MLDKADSGIDQGLVEHWQSLENPPGVIVFDLDYTLWPFFLDKHIKRPISGRQTQKGTELVDRCGNGKLAYSDVTKILRTLKRCVDQRSGGYLAIASKSPRADYALEAVDIYGWREFFSSFQIYNLSKNHHMNAIKKELALSGLDDVLFFDDNKNNVGPTASLGVCPFLVGVEGLNMKAALQGLSQFSQHKSKLKANEQ